MIGGRAVSRGAWLPVLVALMALLTGCYRLSSPPQIDEPIRIEIVGNDSHLVRQQAYLTEAIGRALSEQFGWRVSDQGSAKLQIAILEERIEDVAHDRVGTPTGWRIRLRATALLVTRDGNRTGSASGTGTLTDRGNEPEALDAAAKALAEDLLTWLDSAAVHRRSE